MVDCKSNCPKLENEALHARMNLFYIDQNKGKERYIGMRQTEGVNQTRKDKHLNWEERIQIETLQREGLSKAQIGTRLGRPARTIHREIGRGWVLHRTGKYSVQERYSADRGQTVYERRMRDRVEAKPVDERLAEYLRVRIVKHRESPEAVASRMRKGCDISKYTRKQIQAVEDWINNYPRKVLDFETAEERFIQEWAA